MRSLEQRIAEINRRSEEIIKKRKTRRKRLVLACIPVVLGISLAWGIRLPERVTEDTVEPGAPENFAGVQDVMDENAQYDYVRMEIAGQDFAVVSEAPNRFIAFVESLQTYTLEQHSNSTVCDGATSEETRGAGDENKGAQIYYSSTKEYTVCLVAANGESICYHLAGNILREENTDTTYVLTAKQAEDLRKLLGVSTP